MTPLSTLQRRFINEFQGGFSLDARPYAEAANKLGCTEAQLLQAIEQLLLAGIITRFGPFYNADRMGGAFTLAALSVPDAQFDQVAELVNQQPEVAHNYRREHRLNMWFIIGADSRLGVSDCISRIEQASGLEVFNLPKLQEFYLGLKLYLDERGGICTVPMDLPMPANPTKLDEQDRKLVALTQSGLPLQPEPYAQLAEQAGMSQRDVLARLQSMLNAGIIRRIGAAPNHYRLGLRANGMTVWDIRDDALPLVGTQMGALDFVSHCYERPRILPDWPYNLFAMVHGITRDQVQEKLALMKSLFPHRQVDVLFSSKILKKTGLRIAA